MAIAILAQGESLDTRPLPRKHMQDEEDQLLHELQLHSVIAWTRWWCFTSKVLVLVFKKEAWGVIGGFLNRGLTCVSHC